MGWTSKGTGTILGKTLNAKYTHNRTKSSNDNTVQSKNPNAVSIKNNRIQTIYLGKEQIRIDDKKPSVITPFNNRKTKSITGQYLVADFAPFKKCEDSKATAKFHENLISYGFRKNGRKYKEGQRENDYGERNEETFLSVKRASAPTDLKKDPIAIKPIEGGLGVRQGKVSSLSIKGRVQLLGKDFPHNTEGSKALSSNMSPKNEKENGAAKQDPYRFLQDLCKSKKESQSNSSSPHYGKEKFFLKLHKHAPSLQGHIPEKPEDAGSRAKTQKSSLSKLRINLGAASPYLAEEAGLSSLKGSKEAKSNDSELKAVLAGNNENSMPIVLPLSVENVENHQIMKEKEEIIGHIKKYFKEHNEPPPTGSSFYRVGRLLGKGAFGKVNLGMHKLTGKLVAIKSISKQYLTDANSRKKLMQEYTILKKLQHPNVLRLYETFDSIKRTLIVVELCSGGDLLNYVRKHKKLSERLAKFILKKLLEGLHHCHSRGVIHRDIKLDNVLLNKFGELKICDFGVSRVVPKDRPMTEQCGTPAYIAPEILKGAGYEGFAADIWSAGVALYAMLYGTVPFKSNNMKDLHALILKGKYTLKEGVSKEGKDLVRRMLERNPYRRIMIPEILSHVWMQDIDENISLFTSEEKEALEKQYCHTKRNSDSNTLFTEQNVDSTFDEQLKNNTSKSAILAPFNSTRSNPDSSRDYVDSGWPIQEKREVLCFAAKARDIDRQYERNNNGDIDNGVYNKFVCESTERSPSEVFSSSESGLSDVYTELARVKPKPNICLRFNEKKTVVIDESTLRTMEAFGYPQQYVAKCLNSNEFNHATATYYLLTNHYF
eukprot:TRINITY_DN3435_c0_g3_i1.p1 TRINITY_DN3435_c0_g3~~TRINITY_DN3435_c0_g3_i1.p1  ORF type:complete len:828 (+),score=213.76 TRINITY_DN3435_c0_g3_i1:497-2980(+)